MHVNRTEITRPSIATSYDQLERILPRLNNIQSVLYESKKSFIQETKNLGERDVKILKMFRQQIGKLPDSLKKIFKLMIQYNECSQIYKKIVRDAQKSGKELKKCTVADLLPIIIKSLMKSENIKDVVVFIKSVSDDDLKINLIHLLSGDIIKAGYFDEIIEMMNSVPVPEGLEGPCDRLKICRDLFHTGEFTIALKLYKSLSEGEKEEVLSMGFNHRVDDQSDFKEFLKSIFMGEDLDKCLEIVEKEASYKMIVKALIELGRYKKALEVSNKHIEKTDFKEISAKLLKGRDYNHAIGVLNAIPDPRERTEALKGLSLRFYDFGMIEFGTMAESLISPSAPERF